MPHQHSVKILDWGLNANYDSVPIKYGCLNCDEVFTELPKYEEVPSAHDSHAEYVDDCFGCKAKTLELSTGDAAGNKGMNKKKWNAELDAYADARAQGIQPAGTTMKAVAEAKEASDKLGVAYNAESMPAAPKINKQSATVMKETGTI
jgi:hypothetical protein